MATRTLNTTWKQFEKLVQKLLATKAPKPVLIKPIDELSQKTNESRITDALATLLVTSYTSMEKVQVRFSMSDGKKFPEWATSYNLEEKILYVNPVGVFQFHDLCEKAVAYIATPEARESFDKYRYHAFLAELRKIDSRHLLFILILQQVAKIKEISRVEKRGGVVEPNENEDYMTLLWALKELETLYSQSSGVNLRAENNVSWFESEWVAGK